MKLKSVLFGIFTVTLLSLGVWVVILFNIDPDKADKLVFISFIASFFLWFSGILTFSEYFIKIRLSKGEMIYAHLPTALRHSVMIALTISLIVALQFTHLLNILDAILIIIIAASTELYFRARPHGKSIKNSI